MKCWALFAAVLCFTLRAFGAAPELMDGVAAVVNDKVITYSEVVQYARPAIQQLSRDYSGDTLREKVQAAQMDALNNLIDRALIVHEYYDKGYKLPDNVVDTQIDEIIATDFSGNRTTFIKTLEAEKMTISEYREKLKERIIVQAMRNRKLQQEVVVSPSDIEKYYQQHLDDFKEEDQIKLRMIFIKRAEPIAPAAVPAKPVEAPPAPATNAVTATAVPAQPAEPVPSTPAATNATVAPPVVPAVDTQRKLAEELLAKLKEGDSFESLAKVYSQAREAEKGGDWGWIGRDILQKKLSEVAFKLKPRQHSEVLETSEGYYILFVEDFKASRTRPLTEVRTEIEKNLQQQERTKVQEAWVKQLRGKAYIRLF